MTEIFYGALLPELADQLLANGAGQCWASQQEAEEARTGDHPHGFVDECGDPGTEQVFFRIWNDLQAAWLNCPDFLDHKTGEPYNLTRQHWLTFAGFPADLEGPALWAAIASMEAHRKFNPLAELCYSELAMDSQSGAMRWWYQTTSGTQIEIVEHRTLLTRSASGYPGTECSDELPPPAYRVTIPTERDHPGRYHWQQLRSGGAYCD